MHNESQNIVMVVFAEYPTDVRVRREAEALQSEGYSVEVICIGPKKSQKRDTHNGVHIHRIVMKKNRNNKLAYFFQYGFFIFRAFLKLSFLHLRKKYKIVHIHNLPDVLVFCAILPKLSGAKILLDMHEIMPEFFMRKYNISESQFIIWLLKKMEKLSASFADHVIVATPFLYDIITERATRKEKCTTVLNLPDLKYLNNNKKNS